MVYKRFSFLIILRIVLIIANVLIIAWIFGDMRLFFNQVILCLVLTGQIAELIHFVNHTNRELARLFLAIRYSDFSISFKNPSLGRSFSELRSSLTEIISAYKQVKIEKEVQYQFLQMLVRQIHIGIISLKDDEIVLINPTAEKLLNVSGVKNWRLIREMNPALAEALEKIGDSGRGLLEIRSTHTTKVLSMDVSTMLILDQPHQLITLQDINAAIEQKEIETWHKLIRILTHEIMNSVTPIASLTETMQAMLSRADGSQKELEDLSTETISDVRFSLNTIQKRSEGLLKFVEDYRKLTRIPKPMIQPVVIREFMEDIFKLMYPELRRRNIAFRLRIDDDHLTSSFDAKLIEQVIINLITNSIHAVETNHEKLIELSAYPSEGAVTIAVADNGTGIPDKVVKEIFIPFFSTKKEGSGIGLSLSKQIMSLHGGSIKVNTTPGTGTTFYLQFK